MTTKLIVCWAIALSSCLADTTSVKQLLQSLLDAKATSKVLTPQELNAQLQAYSFDSLSEEELMNILPLAEQCLHSSMLAVRRDGMAVILDVSFRADSSKILKAYVKSLGAIASDASNPLHDQALFVIGHLYPQLPPESIAYLNANLESKSNTTETTIELAELLLRSQSNDPAIVHRIITLVNARSDSDLKNGVLHQLGLLRTNNPEALEFISENLTDKSPETRQAAITAVGRLFPDQRGVFLGKLTSIA